MSFPEDKFDGDQEPARDSDEILESDGRQVSPSQWNFIKFLLNFEELSDYHTSTDQYKRSATQNSWIRCIRHVFNHRNSVFGPHGKWGPRTPYHNPDFPMVSYTIPMYLMVADSGWHGSRSWKSTVLGRQMELCEQPVIRWLRNDA